MKVAVMLVTMVFASIWTASNGQVLSFMPPGGFVSETVGTVQACVTYSPLPASEEIINLSTRDSSAVAGEDYVAFVGDLTFSPTSESVQCVDITINEDSNLEAVEFLDVVISSGGADIATGQIIIQNVGTVTVGFSQSEYTLNEDDGGLVCVVLLGGTIQSVASVTVTLNATDGSATAADNDYDPSILVDIDLSSSTTSMGECISAAVIPDSVLEGDERFTLTINGNPEVNLSPTMSQAQIVIVNDDAECPDPPELIDGSSSLSTGESTGTFPRDATATYSCSIEFDLVGVDTLTCQLGNVWSPAAPGSCIARECQALDAPTNGMVTPNTLVFTTASYSCNEGYMLMGDQSRDCLLDQMWTGAAPTCEPRDCGVLTPPTDGSIDHTTTTFMSTATYTCNSGFTVEGDTSRTCQADGTWSGSDSTCRLLAQCNELNPMAPLRVTTTSNQEGGIATYTCDPGFQVLVGGTRTCRSDSTWSGIEPTCSMITVVGPDGLTEEERRNIGIGVGVALAAIIIIIVIVVVIIVAVYFVLKKRSSDKYVLNYSTVYGNQQKNELKSRPVEPSTEDPPEYNERSVDETADIEQPPQEMDLAESVEDSAA